MANYVCPACAANNPEPGTCILCGKRLGSYRRALGAALLSSLLMSGLWMFFTVVVRLQFPLVACVFGAVVSYCVLHFSGGSGLLFQCIASAFTLIGIVVADSASLLILAVLDGKVTLDRLSLEWLWTDMGYRMVHDPYTILYYALGFITGLFLLRAS
ncbi:MAG: hypothetical protein JNN01_23455 [Opitutaceae bacterium]|nr:hypothetical protein [Opitutaceae bacterium]